MRQLRWLVRLIQTLGVMKPALSGIVTIAVLVLAIAYIVPDEQVRRPVWLFVYFAIVACAWFCWRHPKSPTTPSGWLQYFVGTVILALVLVVIDTVVYGGKSGHVLLDVSLFVLAGVVTVSGVVYSWVRRAKNDA